MPGGGVCEMELSELSEAKKRMIEKIRDEHLRAEADAYFGRFICDVCGFRSHYLMRFMPIEGDICWNCVWLYIEVT